MDFFFAVVIIFQMKRFLIILFLVGICGTAYPENKRTVLFFHSPHCHACLLLSQQFLPGIKAKYGNQVAIKELDVTDQNNLALLISITARFTKEGALTPTMLVGNKLIRSRETIEKELPQALDDLLTKRTTPGPGLFKTEQMGFSTNISAAAIIKAGLLDSANPCTLAAIAFFLSFMTLYGWRKRELLLAGSSYCLAVFLSYLALGLGLFQSLYPFLYRRTGYILIQGFYYLAAGICFLLALAALLDYIRFKETGDAGETILRLPDFLNINVTGSQTGFSQRKASELVITAFIMGILVSMLEAACSGQVYIPAIVFILKTTSGALKTNAVLILYNFMLILPLVIIFGIACVGINSPKAEYFLKKNPGPLKALMFSVFLLLGTLIIAIS
jgi:cytochrome c biogenesis protein CcdA